MTKPRLLLNSRALQGLRRTLERDYEVIGLWETEDPTALAGQPGGMPKVMLVGGEVTALTIAALPGLQAMITFGSGYEGIDLAAARAHGVRVANCPNVNSADVADHAIALMLAVQKGIVSGDAMVRGGGWTPTSRGGANGSLRGMKVGILGLGAIGLMAADRLVAFGCDIAWWGPRPKDTPYRRAETLLALAEDSDVLLVALRADDSNAGIVSKAVVEALGPRGSLINVARGLAIDEDALIAALKDGRLGSAGLDVFETEPTPASRWADVPNVVLTPHSGGNTRAAILATIDLVKANLEAVYAGKPLLTPVAESEA